MHGFKVGDRVCNGQVQAVVLRLVADDAVEVRYELGGHEPVIEPAMYFRAVSANPGGSM